MFELGIVNQLVSGLPYQEDHLPKTRDMKKCKCIVDIIPEKKCSWNEDIMDFRPYFKFHQSGNYSLNFTKVPEDAKVYVKAFILNYIDWGMKIGTAAAKLNFLKKILIYAEAQNPIHALLALNTDEIVNAIETLHPKSIFGKIEAYHTSFLFFEFLRLNYDTSIGIIDTEVLQKNLKLARTIYNTYYEHKHSPLIPDELLNGIISGMNTIMRDGNKNLDERITAGMILLNTQLGLRISEIVGMETDALNTIECNDGKERYYIKYNSTKSSRSREFDVVKTICTPLAKRTFEYILKLREKHPCNESPFLYVQDIPVCKKNEIVSIGHLSDNYKRICIKYLKELFEKDWPGIPRHKYKKLKGEWQDIAIPLIHSYRVTFASKLYEQKFNADYINSIMSHSPASEVNDAYIVPKKPSEKTQKEIRDIIKDMKP